MNANHTAHGVSTGLSYRRDIDGLRAIAVLFVVAFHAGVSTFRNGFLGVDVFFVISGYLISGIIFDALEREVFSFREFYVRRVNRILPALIAVVVATACMGWLFMYDHEFAALGEHVIASSAFVSNFLLLRQTGYFEVPLKPLLHLWSLAVEEQFYLTWPLAAVIAWRLSKRNLTWVLAGIIGASFTLGMLQIETHQASAAFYLPLGRFWEILSGGLLQHVGRIRTKADPASVARHRWRTELAAIAGAALIAASLGMTIPDGTWPGWHALLTVAGTMLLISSRESLLNRRVLGLEPLVAIGLISYPLYLWHWPLLVFSRLILEGYAPPAITSLAIATAFLLSVVTFRFIEIPIRFGARKRRSAFLLVCSLPLLALLGVTISSGITGTRFSGGPLQHAKWGPEWVAPPDFTVRHGNGVLLFSLPGDSSRTVFMYGDSHINQYWPRVLDRAAHERANFPTVNLLAYGGCAPLPGVNRRGTDWATKPWECDRLYRAALNHARTPNVKTIVISAWWELYTGRYMEYVSGDTSSIPLGQGDPRLEKVFDEFERDIASLVASGKRVYLILPSPTPGTQFPRSRWPQRLVKFGPRNEASSLSRDVFDQQTAWVKAHLRDVAERSGANLIDPSEFLCSGKVCPTFMPSGMPIYRDDNHLRAAFVARYATFLDEVFK